MPELKAILLDQAPLDPDPILEEQRQTAIAQKSRQKASTAAAGGGVKWSADVLKEMWTRYYQRANGDCSRADQAFVVYLVSRGVDEDEVAEVLKAVSKDIESRKAGHLDDYCRRTIQNAVIEY